MGGGSRGWRDWAKGRKDSWTWTAVGDCWGDSGIRGLNGNGKSTMKIKFFKKVFWWFQLYNKLWSPTFHEQKQMLEATARRRRWFLTSIAGVIRKGDKQENSLSEDRIRAGLIKKLPLPWVQNVASRISELQIGSSFFLFLSKNIYCGNSVFILPLYIG